MTPEELKAAIDEWLGAGAGDMDQAAELLIECADWIDSQMARPRPPVSAHDVPDVMRLNRTTNAVFQCLAEHPGLTRKALQTRLGMPGVTPNVRWLLEHGWIEEVKKRPDEAGRVVGHYYITELGRFMWGHKGER